MKGISWVLSDIDAMVVVLSEWKVWVLSDIYAMLVVLELQIVLEYCIFERWIWRDPIIEVAGDQQWASFHFLVS